MRRFAQVMKWLWGTSWPLYAATVLGSNVLGALAIMLFVRYLLPIPEIADFGTDSNYLRIVGIVYVVLAVFAGVAVTLRLFLPVLRWQHKPDEHDPNMVRNLVLRIPVYQAVLCAVVWLIGVSIVTVVAASTSSRLAFVVALATILGGAIVVLLTYLEAELLVRPIAAKALAQGFADSTLEPPVRVRMQLTWIVTSGVPILGMLLMVVGQRVRYFHHDSSSILPGIIALGCVALITGAVGTTLVTKSIVDPISELHEAIERVRRGDANTAVRIYDGSEIGVLQAGFNEMMRGLRERQRVHDLFGRYVGAEVASRALEELPTLGGEDRNVAVLFIDVIGSTSFAVNHTPEDVVAALNDFFEQVVAVVHQQVPRRRRPRRVRRSPAAFRRRGPRPRRRPRTAPETQGTQTLVRHRRRRRSRGGRAYRRFRPVRIHRHWRRREPSRPPHRTGQRHPWSGTDFRCHTPGSKRSRTSPLDRPEIRRAARTQRNDPARPADSPDAGG